MLATAKVGVAAKPIKGRLARAIVCATSQSMGKPRVNRSFKIKDLEFAKNSFG